MKFGVCIGTDIERIKIAAACGYDYVETAFSAMTQLSDDDFRAFRDALTANGISCETANGFLPGELKVTGDSVDNAALSAFIEKGMQRAKELGIEVVVFGSGAARSLNEATGFRRGFEQLADFLRNIAGPIAAEYGISIAIEPLRMAESNIINRVKEGVMLAAASGCANVGGLGDLFHMVVGGDTAEDIRALRGSLLHTHISNPAFEPRTRWYPLDAAEYDYKGFIEAVEYAGCPRCSIEASCDDFAATAPITLKVLRSL